MRPFTTLLVHAAFALALAAPAAAEGKTEQDHQGQRGAQMDQCEPGMGMMCMMGNRMTTMRDGMMEQRAERHLTALKAALKITDAQAKAWDAYAAAVRDAAKAMTEQRKDAMAKMPAATLPHRLDMHEAMLVSHLEQLRKTKAAATALYAVLSDDQKKIADRGMMGTMPMRGPMRGMQRN